MNDKTPVLGVIGGSGLYRIPELEVLELIECQTPFGKPSGQVVRGRLRDRELFFLARHGQGHTLSPSEIPYRANVYALKSLGVTSVLSVSAVGSLKEELEPGHLVIPDQLIDRTRLRQPTFFEGGIVVHVEMADPYCAGLCDRLQKAAVDSGATVHRGGTLVCIEGPQFSTRAESFMYRSFGASLVGMTALPEARLVREASMCYATLALATDYDCWYEHHASVTVDAVLEVMHKNIARARETLSTLVNNMNTPLNCNCHKALQYAVLTQAEAVPPTTRERVKILLEN